MEYYLDPVKKSKGGEEDKKKQAEEKARAEAKRKAMEAQAAAGKNTGGSTNKRTFAGEASMTIPGDKVEKMLNPKDKKAVEAWKRAKARGDDKRFNPITVTAREEVSDVGTEEGININTQEPAQAPESTGMRWYRETTDPKFGKQTVIGNMTDKEFESRGYAKNEYDKAQSKIPSNLGGVPEAAGNKFDAMEISEKEMIAGRSKPNNYFNPYSKEWQGRENERQKAIDQAYNAEIGRRSVAKDRENAVKQKQAILQKEKEARMKASLASRKSS